MLMIEIERLHNIMIEKDEDNDNQIEDLKKQFEEVLRSRLVRNVRGFINNLQY